MAKGLNMVINVKNLTENTVAAARSVLSPKAEGAVRVRSLKELKSLLAAEAQGTLAVVSHDVATLRVLTGTTAEEVEEILAAPVEESGDAEKEAQAKAEAEAKAAEEAELKAAEEAEAKAKAEADAKKAKAAADKKAAAEKKAAANKE